jgi:hypothetical protein
MESSFGARLRLQRERQQVALSAIAEQTKIKLSLLEGLERDDLSQWPGGIFRRSYVRVYAKAIGLSPDMVLREFLQQFPEPVEDVEGSLTAQADRKRPPSRLGSLLGTAFGARAPRRQSQAEQCVAQVSGESQSDDAAMVESSVSGVRQADVESLRPAAAVPTEPAALEPAQSLGAEVPALADGKSGVSRAAADMGAVASLCTRLGQAMDTSDMIPVLEDAAALVDAVGTVVWTWDPRAAALAAVLAHGYADEVLLRLPRIRCDADNAIAAAFRAADTRIVDGSDQATGALVVPLLGAGGCVGVLAVELRHRGEQDAGVRAVLTILAAQLSLLIGMPPLAQAASA